MNNRALIIKIIIKRFLVEAAGLTQADAGHVMAQIEIAFLTTPTMRSDKRPPALTLVFESDFNCLKLRQHTKPRNVIANGKTMRIKIKPGGVASFNNSGDKDKERKGKVISFEPRKGKER